MRFNNHGDNKKTKRIRSQINVSNDVAKHQQAEFLKQDLMRRNPYLTGVELMEAIRKIEISVGL